MLEAKLEPEVMKNLEINEHDWKKRKNIISFKRLSKGEKFELQSSYLLLIFGNLTLDGNSYIQGCFKIIDKALVEGPAKIYYTNLASLSEM